MTTSAPTGLILIDKPPDWTSHDVVARARRLLGTKKVGHTGTLDRPATGLLVLTVGKATRLSDIVQAKTKVYEGVVVFGTATDTDDGTGKVIRETSCEFTEEDMENAVPKFLGEIIQRPPRRSALKMGGERLYKKDLRGEEFVPPERTVTVHDILATDMSGTDSAFDGRATVNLRVECSKGTYIRSIARDLGEVLGCCAHLGELRRLSIGEFTVKDAVTLDQLELRAARDELDDLLLPPESAVKDWNQVELSSDLCLAVSYGKVMTLEQIGQGHRAEGERLAMVDEDGGLQALVRVTSDREIRYLLVLSGK